MDLKRCWRQLLYFIEFISVCCLRNCQKIGTCLRELFLGRFIFTVLRFLFGDKNIGARVGLLAVAILPNDLDLFAYVPDPA